MMAKTQTECSGTPESVWLVTFTHVDPDKEWLRFTRAYFTARGVKSAISHHKNFEASIKVAEFDSFLTEEFL